LRAPKKRLPMEEIIEVQALREKGLEGGAHARGGKRQILLVDGETLDAMSLRSGTLRENITTEGLNVNSLAPGQQLLVGNARLEVSMACTPAINWNGCDLGYARSCGAAEAFCVG
jgi:MOSC domain-containing protein YiiM